MKHFLINALLICVFLFSSSLRSQTPGQIFNFSTGAGSAAVLNQNNDNFISKNGVAFNNSTPDEISQFEQSDWITVFHMMTEPNSDLQTGPSCGATEIVDNQITGQHAAYFRIHDPNSNMGDGDEKLVIRMRTANEPGNAAYGYSLLLDTDLKIGSSDPNSVSGNPGFEIELLYGSGNSGGVEVLNVDGESAPNRFTTLASYPTFERHQRSYALNSNCTGSNDDPVFMDFYVDFADMGITVNTTLRMAFASASSSSSSLGGSASDIGGADDAQFPNDDAIFEAVVLAGPTTSFNNLRPSTLFTTESPDSLTLCAGQTLEIASTTSHYAMDFDGSNDVISFTGSAHNTAFSNNTQTVELWFKTTDATGPMLGYSGTNYPSSQSSFVPILGLVNGKIRGEFWTNSSTNTITSFTNYNDGNFHHVALTSNGTSYSMYVDGVLLYSFNGTVNNSWANFMTVGASFSTANRGYPSGWNFFDGEIAEVRVWNTARTAAQISANYDKTIYTLEEGLEVSLTFPEGTGTSTINNVNGVAGTFSSTPAFVSLTAPITNISVGPFTYLWSNAATTLSTAVSPTVNTDYYVTITDASSVSRIDTITVVANSPAFAFAQDTIKSCGASAATIDAGAGWASYAWSNAATTQTTSVSSSGTYSVTVTDANGCTATDDVVVRVINGQIVQNDTTICSGQTLKLSTTDSFTNNNSMTFDGNGDFVLVPYDNSFNVNTLTIESWVYTGNLNRDQGIFEKGNINTQYVLFYNIGSVLKFRTVHPSGTNTMSVSSTGIGLTPNNWHHIAATYDGANKKIYVDGVLKSTYACTGAINTSTVGSIIGAIGGGTAHGNYYWDGKLDEVRVWNVARSASEIASTYNKSVSAASNGLIGYWNFEEGSGSSTINLVDDQSASLNGDAVFNNTPSPASVASNLTYNWSTAATTSTITVSPSATTKYYVTVSDGISSCTDSVTVTVNNPSFAFAQDTIKSCGANTVTIDAGAGWASYAWSNSATTQTASVSTSGTYSVTVTDNNGCTATDDVVVSVINSSISTPDTTICEGSSLTLQTRNTGLLLHVNANNSLSYDGTSTWKDISGNGNDVNLFNTPTYNSVTNGLAFNGFNQYAKTSSSLTTFRSIYIKADPDKSTPNPSYLVDPRLGSDGYIYSAGFGSTVQFFIVDGDTLNNSWSNVPNTSAGMYIVFDTNYSSSINFFSRYTNNEFLRGTIEEIKVFDRVLSTAEINSLNTSSANNYTYNWSNGDTLSTITVSPTATTKYYVTTSDGIASCIDSVTVTVNNPTFAFAQDTIKSCGANTVTVDAGAGWASYAWSNAATTQTTSVTASGTYTVTVTDANGCTASDDVLVALLPPIVVSFAPSAPSGLTAVPSAILNNVPEATGYGVVYELDIPVTANYANNAINYAINNSNVANTNHDRVAYYMQLDGNWIWVSMDDFASGNLQSLGLPRGQTNNIIWDRVVNNMNVYSNKTGITTGNNIATGNIEMWSQCYGTNANSGIGGNSSVYDFDDEYSGGPNCHGSFQVHNHGANQTLFAYNRFPSNSTGEIGIGNNSGTHPDWTFEQNANTYTTRKLYILVGNTNASFTTLDCNGDTDGSVSLTATGGTQPFTYLWSNSDTTANLTGLSAGIYTVTITDANSCTNTSSVTITEPSALAASTVANANVTCNGLSNGSATASGSGGTSPYTFVWSNSATTASITGLSAGSYTVTVSDANSCTTTSSVTITEPTVLTASSVVNTNISCNGGSNGSATASGTGGTSPYTFAWSNSATTASITGLSAGSYTVTVSDANSCTTTSSVTITEPTVLTASSVVNTNISCNGGNNGSATASGAGGTAPYTFAWSNAATTATASGLVAGTYTVTVSDANSCTSTSSVTITEPSALIASSVVNTNISCNGLSDGSAIASATGGTSPYTFAWSNSATTASITGVTAGTYTVTVSDANSCTTTSSVTITEPAVLAASTVANVNVTCNGLSNGSATASGSGGTSPYTFAWSNSATTASITGLSAGSYTVTVTDANSCTSTSSVTITEPAILVASASTTQNVTIFGSNDGSATVNESGGTPNYTYNWSNGGTAATITNLFSGTYSVTITDGNGCTAVDQVTINEPNSIELSMRLDSNVSCTGGTNGGAGVSITGGVKPYSVLWSNSLTDSTITGLAAGTYSVTVTDANGGTAVNDTTITEPAQLVATANLVNSASCAATNDGAAQVSITGGSLPYSIIWSNSATTAAINSLFAGTYTVTVTDGNNCTTVSTVTVLNNDTVAPVIATQPLTVYLDASGLATITANDLDNGTADNCQLASIAIDSSNFNCSEVGANTVVFTATDVSNNASTTTVTVTVIDSLKPVTSTQPLTVYLDANGLASITASDLDNGTADNCQLASIAIDSSNFNCSEVGANTVVFTATDVNNNVSTANVIVTVVDSIKPIIATQPLTVYLDANGLATITANDLDNGTADNCQVSTISIDSTTFDYTELGPNNVWFKAIDVNSNVDSGIVIVTVLDTTQPILATQPRTIYLDANGQASITAADLDNGTTDNGTLFTIAIDSSNFDCSEVGANTVVFTATDASNNASTANVTVTVTDSLKPIISTQPLTVYLDANGLASITANDLDNGTADNCQVSSISIDSSNFDCSKIGANTIKFKATDASGNADSANVTVTVLDTLNPIIATQPLTVYLDANGSASITANDLDNGTTDNCQIASLAVDSSNFDCSEVGANTVVFTATDANNNTSTANVTVTVLDTLKPIVSTQALTVYLDANGSASITANDLDNGTADNCQVSSISIDSSNFDCSKIGANTIKFKATDASGNADSANVTVTVLDTLNPIIATQPLTVYLDANGSASITANDLDNGTADNCQIANIAIDSSNFDCSEVGANTVVFTATDVNNNATVANVIVTVVDSIKPTLATQALTVYLDANGSASITANDMDNGTTDNCQIASLAVDSSNFDCSEVGANTVVFTATDANNNTSTANVTVTVLDTLKPIVSTQALTVYLDANGSASITANDLDNGTADNCQVSSISIDSSNFDVTELGANNVWFSAIDANGNADSSIVIVTVLDTILPMIANCPADITVSTTINSCDAIVNWTLPTASDNGQLDSLVSNFSNGSTFSLGTTTITYVAYDQSMNTDTCSFTITVIDSVAPIIANAPSNISVSNDAGQCGAVVAWTLPTATDNCQLDSLIATNVSGTVFTIGTTTVTYIAYDAAMNTDTISFTITVNDTELPTISCIADTTICGGVFTYAVPTATDNCGIASVVRTSGLASGTVFPVGSTIVTHVVTDIHGNIDSCSFTVTRDALPTVAVAGSDYNVCVDTVMLSGNTAVIGTGVWGTTTTGVLITDAANPTTTAVLQRGSNELIWTISNGVCASSSDTITIIYDSEPTIADAGADQIICEERGTVMEANTPLIGLGTWSIISGTAIPDDENDPRAVVTGLSDGENTLVWTINNGTCNVSTDTVNVKGADNPALTIVGDTTIYEEDGAQLYVISDIPATRYQWDPVFSLDNGAIRIPYATPTENTVYTVRVTTADECFTEGSMEVTVIRGLVIPGAFTPNDDGMNDTWDIKNLEQFDSYSIIVYDGFGSEVFKSTNYSPWNGTYEGRDLTVGSYYYLIDYQLKGDKEIKAGVISILR